MIWRVVSLVSLLGTPALAQQAQSTPPAAPASAPQSAQQQALLDEAALEQARRSRLEAEKVSEIPRLTSELGIFTVVSKDSLRAGAIASRADDIYRHLQKLISLPSKTKYMILIELVGETRERPVAQPYQLSIDLLGNDPIVSLRIHVGGGIDIGELHCALVRVCLYELALRQVDLDAYEEEDEGELALPLWLTTGVEQAVLWRGGRLDRELFSELFKRSDVLSVKDILDFAERSRLDASTQHLFDASCAALMLSLLNQPGGEEAILDMVQEGLSSRESARASLMKYFHALGLDDKSLQKWWALELANMATPNLMENITPLRTETMLVDALKVLRVNRETGQPLELSLDDVRGLMAQDNWRELLPSIHHKLIRLNLRAFQGYRPIITQYQNMISLLRTEDDVEKVEAMILELVALRIAYRKAATRARDYLDWYEMTHTKGDGNANLQQYLRLRAMLRQQQPSLNTPMSRYLRDIEQLMDLKAGQPLPKSMSAPKVESTPSTRP